MKQWFAFWLCLLLLSGYPILAANICLDIDNEPDVRFKNLEKLVRTEMQMFPAYRVDSANCQSELKVDLFTLAGAYNLTVQISGQVPLRYSFTNGDELGGILRKAIALVLDNDPVRLRKDITHYSKASLAVHNLRVRGNNLFRIELFQQLTLVGDELSSLPGMAFSFTRSADHWQVYGKGNVAAQFDRVAYTKASVNFSLGADVGVGYELNNKNVNTPYASLGAGIQHLSFEGYTSGNERKGDLRKTGPVLYCRTGYRFFRITNFDFDIFVASYIPLFLSQNEETPLFRDDGKYTPSFQFGIGVGL
ncbi:MAG: hypothetical protein HQK83_16560 [Fibrobacteria bacterium]|nr:hypothetical protein [Fibrobacteria bacterium]